MIQTAIPGILQRQSVRQFIKFCIIGLSSTAIDAGILRYLIFTAHWHWMLAQTLSFSVAVSNGFLWNSLWTFRGMGSGRRHELCVKFVVVNIVGLVFNFLIMKTIFLLLSGHLIQHGNPTLTQLIIAKAIAIMLVSLWNFFANKRWTFT